MGELELGSTLYKLYHGVINLESAALKGNKACTGLTVNELNLIECIRRLTKGSQGPTISAIASEMDITRPSTTVAVNKLVAKSIVTKTDSADDGRSVRVKLTAKGEKAYSAHRSYQNTLVKEAGKRFTEEGYTALVNSLDKLRDFFDEMAENSEE